MPAGLVQMKELKIITKRSRKETHSFHASGSGADEGTGVSPGVPDALDYDLNDDISWKLSEDDQDKDKNEDDENVQDDDNDAKSRDDELKREKSDEDATDVEDQGNKTDKDTNANLEGRNDVMRDVILPQVQAT
ncbi:hypothetical protein Tco_0118852 [Tanacetum coccineum]